jgi:hypothetical protein
VITDKQDANVRGRAALRLAGRLLVGALLIEAGWCALRSDLVGLLIAVTATIAVTTTVAPR